MEANQISFGVVSVKPGDVVVFMTDKTLNTTQSELVSKTFLSLMPEGVKVLVLNAGDKLAVIQKGEIGSCLYWR